MVGGINTFIGRYMVEELGVSPMCRQEGLRQSELSALVKFCISTNNGPIEFNKRISDRIDSRPPYRKILR